MGKTQTQRVPIERILVVEDDPVLRESLYEGLSARFAHVETSGSLATARQALSRRPAPDVLILDVELPDGSALDLVEATDALPAAPLLLIISGAATPMQSFELARSGARGFLPKPLTLSSLEAALASLTSEPPDLRRAVRATVGHRSIHAIEDEIRDTMLNEALARSGGSRRGAARLLDVSRQLVQHMIRRNAAK